jgi:hypothetical protein
LKAKVLAGGVATAVFFSLLLIFTSGVSVAAEGSEEGLYIPSMWDYLAMLLWEPIFMIVFCGSILGVAVYIRIRKQAKFDELLDVM